jgi:phosphomannomutase
VVITASHNPAEWNGVKFLTREGRAPAKAEAEAIFRIFDQGDYHNDPLRQRTSPMKLDPHVHHVDAVLELVNAERIRRRGFSVVLDSINGAGAKVGRMLLDRLGCTVHHLNAEPAATFAHAPEPIAENLTDLCGEVRAAGADIGFAQDPDADRVAIVDEAGRYIGEEYSLALAARQAFRDTPGPAATNLSTSRLLDDVAAAAGEGCSVHRTPVGEANVVDGMKAHDCVIGGEGNGGVIHPKVVHVRDSLVGIALVLDLLAAEQRPLSEVVGELPAYAMIKEKVTCERERIDRVLATVRQAFAGAKINDSDGVRVDWPAEGKWVHIRASNTEPIMRLIVEARDAASAENLMGEVRTHLQSAD